MTEIDRTVQMPVSLIERVRDLHARTERWSHSTWNDSSYSSYAEYLAMVPADEDPLPRAEFDTFAVCAECYRIEGSHGWNDENAVTASVWPCATAALLSQPTPTAESRDHDLVSVVDGTTWVQRNDGWQHVDVLDREFRMRRSAFHGLMVGVDGHWAYVGDDEGRMRDYLTVPAPVGPPRIEDMAPGTTFTACMQSNSPGEYIPSDWDTPKRWFAFGSGRADRVVSDTGWPCMLESIDPSTIRDVTPPAVTE